MVAVHPAPSVNVDALPLQCFPCHQRWIQYVVMQDAVLTKVDAASLQCLHGTCSAPSAVCSVPAWFALPSALSQNVAAVPMQWMQCPSRWMQYAVTDDAVPMKVDAVCMQWTHCPSRCKQHIVTEDAVPMQEDAVMQR